MSKTSETLQKLQEGVQAVFTSERFKEFLTFIAKFRNYSANNCILIAAQRPDASLVASYTDWQRQHKRQVKKGAKSITILAPHTYKEQDPKTGEEHTLIGYHAASVFDVSDTYSPAGDPLPEFGSSVDCDVDGYLGLLEVLIKISPVPVEFEDIKSDAHGYFDRESLRIAIKKGMSEGQTISTLIHEQAHAWLHAKGAEHEKADRRTKEVQAQAISYVVCQALDIPVDNEQYSFDYIAGWSSGKDVKELKESLDTIRKTSDQMLQDIENELHKAA